MKGRPVDVFTLYVKKTVIRLAVGIVLGAVAAWAVGANEYISGWLIGSLVNLLYFVMLSSRLAKSARMPAEQALVFIRGGVVVRLLLIMLVLIVVLQFPQVRIFFFVAGVMMYRVLIFGELFVKALQRIL